MKPSRITHIRATPVTVPLEAPLLHSNGAHWGRFVRTVVEVETDDGYVGLGEFGGGGEVAGAGIESLITYLKGHNVFELEGLRFAICNPTASLYNNRTQLHAAIEFACLDIMGQRLGVPVAELLGGRVRDAVDFASYLFFRLPNEQTGEGEVRTSAQLVAHAKALKAEHGFKSHKLKGGVYAPDYELECYQAVANAFPKDRLRFDPNSALSLADAITFGKAIEALNNDYFEDPVFGMPQLSRLREFVRIPISTNTVVVNFEQLAMNVLNNPRAVDVILLDTTFWGGIRPCIKAAAICDTFGLGVAVHSSGELGIQLATMLHMGAVVPNLGYAADAHYHHLVDDIIVGGKMRYVNGAIKVPTGPGLGVTLDRNKLAEYHELFKQKGGYTYDRDPSRPGWYPLVPNTRWKNPERSFRNLLRPNQTEALLTMTTPDTNTVASTSILPPFVSLSDLIRDHARRAPQSPALNDGKLAVTYAELDALMDRVAASLQRDGLRLGDVISLCAAASVRYAVVFLGALRAGVVVAPLAPSSTAASLRSMLRDAQAQRLFIDVEVAQLLDAEPQANDPQPPRIALDGGAHGIRFEDWLASEQAPPSPVEVPAQHPFNIIYSSGTTGTPKGIVQSHAMRWAHIQRASTYAYAPDSVTLLATPLYSNTTLVSFFPTLGWGGSVHLMAKFDALGYLQTAQRIGATHTMLVPVQYQRIMAHPSFDQFKLSTFQAKFSTSAPFRAELKADVLARWPGGLIEFYGMTEGGGTCILEAHLYPHKLHTVGTPAVGSDIRLIDEAGRELAAGSIGELVGASPSMMTGYHNQDAKTREVEWFDAAGTRFIRTGDVGRFDEDGFLTLLDRRKDMIISGGYNVYPSDLESELRAHSDVADVAVVGVASEQWGETPVAYVVQRAGATADAKQLMAWYNARAGKTQRLSDLRFINELPRSAIGKVLKRELRDLYATNRD